MLEFKEKADAIIKERYGITVEHVKSKWTYESYFYHRRTSKTKNFPLQFHGFPRTIGSWCNSVLKREPLRKIEKGNIVYVGIAADEPNRFHSLSETKISPLVEANWDESKCLEWCKENDLLSPIYTSSTRGGCWFCHKQPIDQLRKLRQNYPEYWDILLKWDLDSPMNFKADGHSVHDYDKRFALEEKGLIPNDKTFKWKMID